MHNRYTCLIAALLVASTSAFGLTVSISGQFFSPCGQPRGELFASASGGAWPYSYSWSNGATTSSISSLNVGSYTVTVTDNVGTQATATQDVTLLAQYPTLNPVVSTTYCMSGAPYAFFPINDPTFLSPIEPTTFTGGGAVDQFVSDNGSWWIIQLEDFGTGTYPITYSDALGCTGMFNFMVNGPLIPPGVNISGIGGSCSNGSTGAATVSVTQGNATLSLSILDAQDNVIFSTSCDEGGWTGGIIPFTSLAPGDYWAVLDMDGYCLFDALPYFLETCVQSAMFTIPDLGVTCGTVEGTSWYDVDGDCAFDAEDVGVPYSTLLVEPGSHAVLTGADGTYQFELVDGSYTLAQGDPSLIPICPASQPVPFIVNDDASTIDLANGSAEQLDLSAFASGGPARPGFSHSFHAEVRNVAPQLSGPVTITVTLDNDVDYVNAAPTPTSVAGNILTWELPALGLFGAASINVAMSVPVGTAPGTLVLHAMSVSNTLPEGVYTNNTVNWATSVTGSFDPNDKVARTSSGESDSEYLLDLDDHIDYTIRFQNTGTDTAFTVVVTDTLSETLDMLSFEQGVSSHPFDVRFKQGRVVEWRFDDILLPESTTNEGESHGLVQFRIKPALPLVVGTVISNVANIYFDYNDPVITEPSVLTAEFSTGQAEVPGEVGKQGQLHLRPNPASDQLKVTSAVPMDALTILTTDGRVVLRQAQRATNASIDVSSLMAGAYLLIANMNNGSVQRGRFIKQ